MLIQIIIALFLGLTAGTITGLIPGIHINLVGAFLVSFTTTSLFFIQPLYLVIFITSMAITHTFIDFIPSILLGSPDTDTELSVLPGHKMLFEGKGYEAILLTCYGSLASIFLLLIIIFPSLFIISKTYDTIQRIIPFLLILIIGSLILMEKRKINALIVVFLTGTLGFFVLNTEILKQPLLPLLTGLFGSSMLLISINNKLKIPEQKITKPEKPLKPRPIIGSLIASPLCCFLPGLGAGQAAIIGNTITKIPQKDKKSFLILLGATNTLVMAFSFITLYAISKTRTGATVAIKDIIGMMEIKILFLILITIMVSGILAFFITKKLSFLFSKNLNKINYTKLSITTLVLLTIIILSVSKILGLFVFIISTITGIYCISLKVRRTNMMGCLIIPTIIFYLFL